MIKCDQRVINVTDQSMSDVFAKAGREKNLSMPQESLLPFFKKNSLKNSETVLKMQKNFNWTRSLQLKVIFHHNLFVFCLTFLVFDTEKRQYRIHEDEQMFSLWQLSKSLLNKLWHKSFDFLLSFYGLKSLGNTYLAKFNKNLHNLGLFSEELKLKSSSSRLLHSKHANENMC